jgi:beta-lactamase superfamily II metal-dependent hydrolase
MGYEVDFLPVGDGEKSGDAICVRFGDLFSGDRSRQFVMVIDGGTSEGGENVVKHVKGYYGTDRVDLVVSTHPDNDHVAGLRAVVEQLRVGRLWMHRPWARAAEYRPLFDKLTCAGLKRSLCAALDTAVDLEKLATARGIPIDEPFSDVVLPFADIGIRVLGPTQSYYSQLLPHFRDTPAPASVASAAFNLFSSIGGGAVGLLAKVAEAWGIETLVDPPEDATSAENNSSVVLTIGTEGRRLLFTADAGVPALTQATEMAERCGISLPSCNFVQIPHHGSRRNVGPTLLDRMLGPKGQPQCRTALVSCAPKSQKHPARRVTNAFQRRGAKDAVVPTKGQTVCEPFNAPTRAGWIPAPSVPFHTEVED